MTYDNVSSVAGALSGLWRKVLEVFFLRQPSFSMGVTLPTKCRGTAKRIWKAGVKFMIQDELAIRSTLQNKGSSGSCPCPCCLNIYGGAADADIPPGVDVHHYATCLPSNFQLATDATVWRTHDFLASKVGESAARRAELAQNLGQWSRKQNDTQNSAMHRQSGNR